MAHAAKPFKLFYEERCVFTAASKSHGPRVRQSESEKRCRESRESYRPSREGPNCPEGETVLRTSIPSRFVAKSTELRWGYPRTQPTDQRRAQFQSEILRKVWVHRRYPDLQSAPGWPYARCQRAFKLAGRTDISDAKTKLSNTKLVDPVLRKHWCAASRHSARWSSAQAV